MTHLNIALKDLTSFLLIGYQLIILEYHKVKELVPEQNI